MPPNWYDREGRPISMEEWVALLGDGDYKRVAEDTVGDLWVSTVWLGLDTNYRDDKHPLIFETMVWTVAGDKIIDGPIRYMTEEAAVTGHRYVVAQIERRNELYGGPL